MASYASGESVRNLGNMLMGLGDRFRQSRQIAENAEARTNKSILEELYKQRLMQKYDEEQESRLRRDALAEKKAKAPKSGGKTPLPSPDQLLATDPQKYIKQVSSSKSKLKSSLDRAEASYASNWHPGVEDFDKNKYTKDWIAANPYDWQYILHSSTNAKGVSLMGTVAPDAY